MNDVVPGNMGGITRFKILICRKTSKNTKLCAENLEFATKSKCLTGHIFFYVGNFQLSVEKKIATFCSPLSTCFNARRRYDGIVRLSTAAGGQ